MRVTCFYVISFSCYKFLAGLSRAKHFMSIHKQPFEKEVFLKISQNSPENTCAGESLFDTVAGVQTSNVIRKGVQRRCFPMNFAKLLECLLYRTPPQWLLLSTWCTSVTVALFQRFQHFFRNLTFFGLFDIQLSRACIVWDNIVNVHN